MILPLLSLHRDDNDKYVEVVDLYHNDVAI